MIHWNWWRFRYGISRLTSPISSQQTLLRIITFLGLPHGFKPETGASEALEGLFADVGILAPALGHFARSSIKCNDGWIVDGLWMDDDEFCNVDISILTISQSRKFTTLNGNSATSVKIAKFFQVRCQLNGIIFYAIVHTKIKTTLSQVDSDGGTNSYTPDKLICLDDIDSNPLKLSARAN